MSVSSESIPLPDSKGPRLGPFAGQIENVQFLGLLSSEEEYGDDSVPHSRVFCIRLNDQKYALKVFNFFSLEEIRPFVPFGEHLLKNKDKIIQHHLDPFFAECRAFGRLVEEEKDDQLAVRCYGYALLSESIESRIREQFGITDWNRGEGDEGQRLRAILKSYIWYKTPFGRKKFPALRKNIEKLNNLGIYNMDIRKENYLGGRLFDFSIAITAPHLNLWTKLRFEDQIQADMNYDLECLDFMADQAAEEKEKELLRYKSGKLRLGATRSGCKNK